MSHLICEIICVGTEILLGDIVNTNSVYLSKALAEMGISVLHQVVVGDNQDRLTLALKNALERSDIVITTGGLGPTQDDITKKCCCLVMDCELELDEVAYESINSFFKKRNDKIPQNNFNQAYVPKGSVVFENTNGTAPGYAIEKNDKCVISLPGPPREMKEMFEVSARNVLKKYSGSTIVSHNFRMFGIGESKMAEIAGDLLENENPTVAPYAKDGECFLRVSALADNKEKAEVLIKPITQKIFSLLGEYIYGTDVNCLEEVVVKLLKKHNLKVAFAESCTGGLIAKRITDIPGSSEVFDCGVVSYSNEVKHKLLNVNIDTLDTFGAVSENVSKQMALGVKALSGADIAVSVTGIAGPGGDTSSKNVGDSFISIAFKDKVDCVFFSTARDDREYNRHVTSSRALNMVRQLIIDEFEMQGSDML